MAAFGGVSRVRIGGRAMTPHWCHVDEAYA
jgi:hypothetical protein